LKSFYFDKDMAQHIELGKQGEQLAVNWLIEKGYSILHRNWRYGKYELDIIATNNGLLHVVEVKVRSSTTFGFPEINVSKKKFNSVKSGAEEFLFLHPQYQNIQFDILSINIVNGTENEFFFIEDVFL
jgi:putative endonuclease